MISVLSGQKTISAPFLAARLAIFSHTEKLCSGEAFEVIWAMATFMVGEDEKEVWVVVVSGAVLVVLASDRISQSFVPLRK